MSMRVQQCVRYAHSLSIIVNLPLVSEVDPGSILWRAFFFLLFFFFPSLFQLDFSPGMGSIPTRSQFFLYHSFSFLPFFFHSFALFSSPFLSSSNFLLPFPPAFLPFFFLLFFFFYFQGFPCGAINFTCTKTQTPSLMIYN